MFLRELFIAILLVVPVSATSVPGIDNFDEVNAHVYRGGQPTDQGFRYLAKIGVKTIIDLREADEHSAAEKRVVVEDGMRYVNVPMSGLTPPTEDAMSKILTILEDEAAGPVFVHCKRGADRTGAVIAAYHISHDNWDNASALKDAEAHKMSPFQRPRKAYILHYHRHAVDSSLAPESAASATSEMKN